MPISRKPKTEWISEMPGPMSAPNGNKLITYNVEARKKAGSTGKTALMRERKTGQKGNPK